MVPGMKRLRKDLDAIDKADKDLTEKVDEALTRFASTHVLIGAGCAAIGFITGDIFGKLILKGIKHSKK